MDGLVQHARKVSLNSTVEGWVGPTCQESNVDQWVGPACQRSKCEDNFNVGCNIIHKLFTNNTLYNEST